MTDQPDRTPEDILREEAKRLVEIPPEPVPGAQDLPDDVRDGRVEAEGDDDGSSPEHIEGE